MPCASLLPLQVTSIRLVGLPLRRANQHPTGQGRLQRSVELLALESQLVLLLQRERQEDAAPDAGGQAVLRCAGGGLCSVLSGNIRGRGGGLLRGWGLFRRRQGSWMFEMWWRLGGNKGSSSSAVTWWWWFRVPPLSQPVSDAALHIYLVSLNRST